MSFRFRHALAESSSFEGTLKSLSLDGPDLVVEELAELPLHELLVRF
jgi:hypothetical protein